MTSQHHKNIIEDSLMHSFMKVSKSDKISFLKNLTTQMTYNNLPLKYPLWTRAIGAHLVGRCVLYSYRFLDPLIRWIATGDGWNLRQPTWLQSWASRTHRTSGCWGTTLNSVKTPSGKSRTIARTHCNESFVARAYQDIYWIWKCHQLQRLWSST